MPGLMAIIGADANPMRRELAAVQAMARTAGVNIRRGLDGGGGGGHSGSSGVIREAIVLMREIGSGNLTRVPGSLSILLQRMGVLKYIITDTTSAAQLLSDAWAAQSQAASLASIAAVRKAAASQAAFYADTEETEATLAQAVADEEGAAAAIHHAQATQAKAVASAEAAAASGAAASAGVGVVGVIAGVVLAIGVGIYAAYKLSSALSEKLAGLKTPDFHPEYIAKHLKAANSAAELQREINREILKTVDHYNSAAKAAERVAAATDVHYDHLLELNDLKNKHDPAKREAGALAINAQKRNAQLGNMIDEKTNLENEGKTKQAQADAIKVASKESDANILGLRKKEADEAQKYLDEVNAANNGGDGSIKKKLFRAYNAAALSGVSGNDLDAAEAANKTEANRRINAYHSTVDRVAENDVTRTRKSDLGKEAGASISKAVEMASTIANQKAINATANANDFETAQAKLRAEQKMMHGSLTGNQQIGAYTAAATSTLLDLNRKQLYHLGRIDNALDKIGGGGGDSHRNLGKVQH